MIQRLLGMGLNVVAIDWRGQGMSDRVNPDPLIGHVKEFADYQQDVQAMLAHPRVQAQPGPRILMAHSMGGCIGLRALIDGLDVQRAVFSAPMFAIRTPVLLRPFEGLIMKFALARGMQQDRLVATGLAAYVLESKFQNNLLTNDRDTWDMMVAHLEAKPELRIGGPSFGWIDAAKRESKSLAEATLPDLPILTFMGDQEKVVSKAAIRSTVARMPNGQLQECAGAKHEIWMEKPDTQTAVWQQIRDFLQPLW